MIEDKLDHDERLRLECLAQAINSTHMNPLSVPAEKIIERAKQFEEFVKND